MSNESLLKKEFKQSDVQRVRNLVNKDFTGSTKVQSGYSKSHVEYKEGDIWEEAGKQWTIKNGIRQNITKLDSAKKAVRVPLTCPKCGGQMKHWLNKKMFRIHGFCFDPCTVEMENDLRKTGLFEQYQKRMMSGNLKEFANDIEAWALDTLNTSDTFVTEDGVIEKWGGEDNQKRKQIMKDLKEYVSYIRTKI